MTALLFGFIALLLVPVVVSQLAEPDQRIFERAELKDARYREFSFRNAAQDLMLAGMLFVPEGVGPFPAAVIIHGSGTSHRDNGWYLTLTQYLRKNGIVVLLPDKRGSEKSEGDWRTASFEDLATDSVAAIDYLNEQTEIALSSIGVLGMSQGGYFAPLVADRTQKIDYLVNVVGGAIPMRDLLVYEENNNLRQIGILPGLSNLLAYPASWSISEVRQREFWAAIGDFDPIPYWRRLMVEALVLYGGNDKNVPSARSAAKLRSLQNPHIEVKIYEHSGHALEDPEGYGNSIFREDALADIRDFILSVSENSE